MQKWPHRWRSASTDVSNLSGLDWTWFQLLDRLPAPATSGTLLLLSRPIATLYTYSIFKSGGMCISVLSHRQWIIEEKHNIQLIWVSVAGLVPSFWELLDLDVVWTKILAPWATAGRHPSIGAASASCTVKSRNPGTSLRMDGDRSRQDLHFFFTLICLETKC